MKWERYKNGGTGCTEWWELQDDEGEGLAEIMFCTPEMAVNTYHIPEGWVYIINEAPDSQWENFPDSCTTHEERIAWVTTEVRLT